VRLKLCWLIFALLVALVIVAISPLRLGGDFRSFVFPLGIIGLVLLVLIALTKMSKWLRFFCILTGVSALGWQVTLFAHDLLIKNFPTEPVTYVLVFFVLPVTFIVGVVGTIVTGIWHRLKH
jgi:hypothetical protein